MADGAYNSGGSGSYGGGGGGDYYHYSGGGGGEVSVLSIVLSIAFFILILGISRCSETKKLEEERRLDRTVYHETANENFRTFLSLRKYEIDENTVMIEQGSSRREGYHCKGIEFMTKEGQDKVVCCSVYSTPNQLCVTIR